MRIANLSAVLQKLRFKIFGRGHIPPNRKACGRRIPLGGAGFCREIAVAVLVKNKPDGQDQSGVVILPVGIHKLDIVKSVLYIFIESQLKAAGAGASEVVTVRILYAQDNLHQGGGGAGPVIVLIDYLHGIYVVQACIITGRGNLHSAALPADPHIRGIEGEIDFSYLASAGGHRAGSHGRNGHRGRGKQSSCLFPSNHRILLSRGFYSNTIALSVRRRHTVPLIY